MKVSDIEVTLIDHCGSDLSVVNAARVSFNKVSSWVWDDTYQEYKEGELKPQDFKLIRYLAQHKHFSPFNHSFISVRVKAPIFVARQLVKHKFMPINEVSRRYVKDEPSFYAIQFRWAADNVKQGSGEEVDENTQRECDSVFWHSVDIALDAYERLLKIGICPEQARAVLPLNSNTEWIWSGTLGAFCDMMRLRLDPHTQKESQLVAQKIKDIIEPLFPVSVKELLSV